MNLALDEEQRLLRHSLERWALDYDATRRRASVADPHGWSRETWTQMAELGLAGLCVEERFGGIDGGPVEVMLAMQALGGALCLEPSVATWLCSRALALEGNAQQQQHWLPRLASGDAVIAWAHREPGQRAPDAAPQTVARRVPEGWRLDGCKGWVRHGTGADAFLVSALVEGGARLFMVPADSAGLLVTPARTHDELATAGLALEGLLVPSGAMLDAKPASDITAINRLGIVAGTAESVGLMKALLSLTLEHLRTRKQFGAALATFQVLQHRVVDMAVAVEQAESMSLVAALSLQDQADDLDVALAQAKVQCNKSLRYVAQQAVQLHGAIGITEESRVGALFRRATVLETEFGDTGYHLQRLARAS